MEFKRRMKPAVNLDLIPMIDVVFQLVLFFLVTSTFIITPGINLNLPEAESSEPVLVSKLAITVLSEEEIYVNRERHTLRSLGPALRGLPTEMKDKVASLVVEGDSDIPYRLMVQVLDILRKEGYRGMALKTRDKKAD
jgi:biopolymer transport protein ExbD